MERAIEDWRGWRDAGLTAPRIAVNVAAAQLRDDDFVPALQRALAAPSAIGIEITESILIGNMERAIEVPTRVRALGVPVAIDDFGTGYSSLAYIATLPIDELKIDRAFVETEAQAAALRALGCDQAQGFLYSPPVPADQLARLLGAGPFGV